jgi:DNA-directed RNA polymerase specialized sigma24 family protein
MVKKNQRVKRTPVPPVSARPPLRPIVLGGLLGATLDRAAASLREQDDAPAVSSPPAAATRGQHLVRLEELVGERADLEREITRCLREGHALGLSYAELGRALGVSRQAARQRAGAPGLSE